MSELDQIRFYADFTGADGRRDPNWKPPEVVGEGLIVESTDGKRVCGFWPMPPGAVNVTLTINPELSADAQDKILQAIERTKEDIKRIVGIREGRVSPVAANDDDDGVSNND